MNSPDGGLTKISVGDVTDGTQTVSTTSAAGQEKVRTRSSTQRRSTTSSATSRSTASSEGGKTESNSLKKPSRTSFPKGTNSMRMTKTSYEFTLKSIGFCLGTVCISRNKCRRLPPNPNQRMHWAEKHRWNKAWGEEVWARLRASYPQPRVFEHAIISATLYAIRLPDYDNAVASMKPLIDSLKGFVIRDDSPDRCEIKVTMVKVDHKNEEHVELRIDNA